MDAMTNEAGPTIRVRGQGGCENSPIFKRIGQKILSQGLKPNVILLHCGTTESLSANCSAGFQTVSGGFKAARDGVCRSRDLHDSRSGERRYKFRYLRISFEVVP
jgi:hypothetical protein